MNGGSTSNRTPPHRQLPRMLLLIHDSTLNPQLLNNSTFAAKRIHTGRNIPRFFGSELSDSWSCYTLDSRQSVLTLVLRSQTRLAHRTNREQLICFWVTAALSLEIELWNRMRTSRSTHFRLLRDANVLWFSEETQGFFAAFAADAASFHAAERDAEI